MKVRSTFWGILSLLIISGAGAYFTPLIAGIGTPVFFVRLFYLCVLLILLGWVWSFLSVRGFTMVREARVLRQQAGEVFEERFRVSNRTPILRLWVEIRDESQLPGRAGTRVLSLIGPHQQRSYIAYTQLNRRGSIHLGPTLLISGDPFGLFLNSTPFRHESELVVLPFVVELTQFPSPVGMFPGGRAIQRRAAEITPQASSVREYAPGDSLRRIHWPSSARRDRLMTKEFDQDPQADVWIFLDAFQSAHFHIEVSETSQPQHIEQLWLWKRKTEIKLPVDTFEYAVSVAGSISNYYIKRGRSVGLVCASDVLSVLPAERGERQQNKILETLTFLNSDGALPLIGLVESQGPSLPRASTVVLITSSTDVTVDLAVDNLIMRNLRPVIVFIDGESFGSGVPSGDFVFRLKERGVPVMLVRKDDDLQTALEHEVI